MATATPAKAETQAVKDLRASLQVKPPGEIIDWINLFVYGDPGVGKTYLIGTAMDDERLHPLLLVDVEGGTTTLRKRKGVDVVKIRSIKELETLYNTLYKTIDPTTNTIHYKTVGIDSLTELADLDMRDIMKEAYAKNPDKVDKDVPSQREWGKSRAHIRAITRAFRDLPCHVVYTAQVATLQEEGQPTKFFPGLSGKLRTEIPGFMDIVGYMTNEVSGEVITRKLQVQGTRRVVAKDRTASLAPKDGFVENPSLPMLWDLIHSAG